MYYYYSLLRPVARNFNWVVLLYKIVDLFDKILDLFSKIVDLFNKIVDLFGKIVDLFGKIVDLLFERGVLPHLENPPGYKPATLSRFIVSCKVI